MSWREEVEELERRRKMARQQGGDESVQRHHQRGKLSIRERIDNFLDHHSFREQGKIAGGATLDDDLKALSFAPANYVLGVGRVNKRFTAVGGEDFTLKGGSPNGAGLRRSIYAENLAVQHKIPLVRFLEGGGGSVGGSPPDPKQPRTVGTPVYQKNRMKIIGEALGLVPVASAALGPVAGFPAGRLVASHFSVMTKDTAQVMIAGPAVVERALNRPITKDELGGAHVHLRSGVVHNLAVDEYDAFRQIRQFLSYMPQNVGELTPRIPCSDPVDRQDENLLSVIPKDRTQTFEMRDVIHSIVDRGSFFEVSQQFGLGQITGYARINGQSVGVTGNDCRFFAGAMTADGAQKVRRFIEICDTFHLPIINLVDEPGFMIGPDSESQGTIMHGMSTVLAAVQSVVPWASVMVRKSYGVAGAAHYSDQGYVLTWPSVDAGALPIEGGVAVAFRRQIAEADDPEAFRKKMEDEFAKGRNPYISAESFAVHDLIDPRETRPYLCDWVELIQSQLPDLIGPVGFTYRP
jgi:acetyl-CoA carboxylase carboxyltransferase component|tara:strand:+ start:4121 stop:5683 length:1563 start_codon:yes stop_codon:yes gene_type:complete